ncbi:alpha/beta hydrolase [Coprobacter tertius]|uniref:Alpha/beta hydrolase n=1 Tax=Coprobacter tertius TaxID=2944915 RepID=A0ABT1MJR3_9BACT|nr:alpha/beta hydrolase [Coprobacter tertius]MCP9612850.1 alpha/beta hydrolase [Coprobacter tertius]
MKKIPLIIVILFITSLCVFAQEPLRLPVWPEGAPEENGITAPEKTGTNQILYNSKKAELFIFRPQNNNTEAAVIICPGGGYAAEAIDYEGYDFAKFLSKNGITGIVLKYRLPNGHKNIPLSDAEQAIRIVRQHAQEWEINPQKVGISGFSAGGHLASTLGTHFQTDTRPDFMLLFYPVITLDNKYTHQGSRENLLGKEKDDPEAITFFSNEKQITEQTPPTLLLLSDDDTVVPPYNSTAFYNGLKKYDIPASIYIFPTGNHGWGCHKNFAYYDTWTGLLLDWLKKHSFIGE